MTTTSKTRNRVRKRFYQQKDYDKNDEISVLYDNSLTNQLNEMNLLYQQQSLSTPWHQRKMNCIIPYKNENINTIKCFKNLLIMQRVNPFKLSLSEIVSSDSSLDGLLSGSEERLFYEKNIHESLINIKYISKTLSGWDDHGIHYLLSKINNQRSDYLLPRGKSQLPAHSYIHIHACESCTDHLYSNNCSVYSASICLSNCIDIDSFHNYDSLLLQEKGLIPCLELPHHCSITSDCSNNDDLKFNHQDSVEVKESDNKKKCSEQYFTRVVYSYNSCGLHFKFPDNSKKRRRNRKSKSNKPKINPFMRVVVYGTDPCALNFPVELGVKEVNSGDRALRAISTTKVEQNCTGANLLENICNNSDKLNAGCNSRITDCYSCDTKTCFQANSVDRNFYNLQGDSNNLLTNQCMETSQSCSNINISEGKSFSDLVLDEINFKESLNNINTNVNRPNNYLMDKALSDTNVTLSQIISPFPEIPSENSLFNFNDYQDTLLPQLSSCFEKAYQSNYSSGGKLVTFSAHSKISFRNQSNSGCRCKRYKKKRKTQFSSKFPGSTNAHLMADSSSSEILLGRTISLENFLESNTELVQTVKLPALVNGVMYTIFFVFFIVSLLLIQDTMQLAMNANKISYTNRDYFEWFN